jgi:hypothetical protein
MPPQVSQRLDHRRRNPFRTVRSRQCQWRDRGHEHGAFHASVVMASEISDHLTARHRMGDQADVFEIEGREHGCQVIGERVVVITASGVVGSAMPPPVVGDAAHARVGEGQHLGSPHL